MTRRNLILVLAASPAALLAQAKDSAGRIEMAKSYIAAFNDGEKAMEGFFNKYAASNTPVATRLDRYRQMKSNLGTITLQGSANESAEQVTMTVKASNSGPAKLALFLNSEGKLTAIRIEDAD